MYHPAKLCILITLSISGFGLLSCNSNVKNNIVTNAAEMNEYAAEKIKNILQIAANTQKTDDSIRFMSFALVDNFYKKNEYQPIWSKKEEWVPAADSLLDLISNAKVHGLFPEDYHFKYLNSLKKNLEKDSLLKMNSTIWGRADLLLTDALIKIMKDFKHGRLQNDSIILSKDSILGNHFYFNNLKKITEENKFTAVLNDIQPKHQGYWELKKCIKVFLDSMDTNKYTYITYPYKKGSTKDSIYFMQGLQKRLMESGCVDASINWKNSAELSMAIKKYQIQKGLKVDGQISSSLIKSMNVSDAERFKRIAITLDRFKQLPAEMPEKYIWVNLPGYYLQVWDNNSMALYSKIICGRPETRTPLLYSNITDMITYPTWTVPNSIIVKQYLPKLRNNPNYLSRIGLNLINNKGERIDPGTVNWEKYSKGIPYYVRQSSGDNNALGVMKFNFSNPYFVYLHDTNQRYLFRNNYRALSHGCVRVQEWEKLAFYIAKNDSLNARVKDTLKYNADSIKNWISRKSHKRIVVKNKLPLFIQYFSCEAKNGKILFYDDIYSEDKNLRDKYFANKL